MTNRCTETLRLRPDAGACDTHIHFFAAGVKRAKSAQKPLPPPCGRSEYTKVQEALGLSRAVLVQPTHYGQDNSVQLGAVAQFDGNARMVAVVSPDVSDAQLHDLHQRGVRGLRYFLLDGGAVTRDGLVQTAQRIAPLGWHIEIQVNGRELPDLVSTLCALPCDVVIAHIGRFLPPVKVTHHAFRTLLTLVDAGAWVKISAPYVNSRSGGPDFEDVAAEARALIAHAPGRMLWASNWPHTNDVPAPSETHLLNLLLDWCNEDPETYNRILCANPAQLYGF
ncbi:amidohydrolase [Sulfitobacter sp. M368]|jgi:D-galactarolactone isomerase|uniref:amidohydrolase family protein n=1 Tax=Sulfitobacter sp. M368 TaxID=2867021 RepID=UPI0021A90783|nr:amidohydrolase family protein [Sulfitobacter sp. M368]UWR16429.1 amidohydrolase family protein [Sulfitobacter sp. M368]